MSDNTNDTDGGEAQRVEGGQNSVEPTETFLADIGSIDEGNEATRQFNSIVNELRRDGASSIRVAIVEVSADV